MPQVKYCYRCGRRVSPEHVDCWYCGTGVRRTLRPERRCPYCDEVVRDKAIKCANCGEFLDNDADVEKEGRRGERNVTAEGGEGKKRPREDRTIRTTRAAGAIDHKTRLKLEAPTAHRLEKPQRDPDAAATAESPTVPESVLKGRAEPRDLIPAGNREVAEIEVEVESAPPAIRTASDDRTVTIPVDDPLGPPPGLFARFRNFLFPPPPPPPRRVEVRENSPFRICGICQTEILASDNYCFHCGQKYARQAFRFNTQVKLPLNFGAYGTAAVLLIPHLLYFMVANKPPRWALLLSTLGVMGVLGYSATNSIDRRNRVVSWILLLVACGIMAVPLYLAYGPG